MKTITQYLLAAASRRPLDGGFTVRIAYTVCAVFLILLVCSNEATAQTTSGSMTGAVADSMGAVIPGATVTATEEAKKFNLTALSDETGRFVFPQVPPGTYTITVGMPGFKRFERKNVEFNANDRLALGTLSIDVGQVVETVEVTAELVSLKAESAERSDTLVAKQIENIGVNGRSPLALLGLVPGIVNT